MVLGAMRWCFVPGGCLWVWVPIGESLGQGLGAPPRVLGLGFPLGGLWVWVPIGGSLGKGLGDRASGTGILIQVNSQDILCR